MEGLTPRQEQVLEFIRASVRANGYPPTVREICAALDLSSPSTVHAHLANLERLGLIKRDPTKPRALDVVGDAAPAASAAARRSRRRRRADPRRGERRGARRRARASSAATTTTSCCACSGDSMIGAGIFDADLIVVHPQPDAPQRRDRRRRSRHRRRRGHHQALLPRGRHRAPAVPRTRTTSRSSSTPTRSSSSAESWGSCASYEYRASRHSRPVKPRRRRRRVPRRRARRPRRALPVVRRPLRARPRGRPVERRRHGELPDLRQRAQRRGAAAPARGAPMSGRVPPVPGRGRLRPGVRPSQPLAPSAGPAGVSGAGVVWPACSASRCSSSSSSWPCGPASASRTPATTAAIYSGTPYTVAAGDDLWTIAEAQYGGELDLRAAVYAIRDANDLETSVLQPGQSSHASVSRRLGRAPSARRGRATHAVYLRRVRDVAQPGSAPALGAGGREFKSRRPDQALRGRE